MRKKENSFDFSALGQAIKTARLSQGLTRDQLCNIINIDPRYLMNIENKGQNPSLQVFYKIITYFQISVDQYFFPEADKTKTTQRRQVDTVLDTFNEQELSIIEATANAIANTKKASMK